MLRGSDSNVKKYNTVSRRIFILSIAKGVIFTGIIAKLFSLQINENKKYLTLSDKNRLREWRLPPVRGEFLDYFGKLVAGNTKVYQLHVVPEQVEDFRYLMVRLKNILPLSEKQFSKILKKKNQQKPWETLIISENLTWDQFSKVNFYLHELSGAKPVLSVARSYPYKENYTHVLGYVAQASQRDLANNENIKNKHVPGLRVGKTGLEKKFEDLLIGTNGVQRYEVNAYGKRIKQIKVDPGKAGQSFKTTLDLEVQKYVAEILSDKAASVCVMDIYNGDIISLVSSPSYDPNAFVHGIDKGYWNDLKNNTRKPLINKAVSGLYPPGSTIKTLVALSALENKIIRPLDTVRCKGKIELFGEKFHCWKKEGHGIMNLRSGMKRSCDVYFYEVARKLGVDRLAETAKRFGLGKKVLSDFIEERSGVVPNTKWKKKFIGQNWYLGETLHSGIGQGYFQSTPLQLCLMTAQIANGGFKIKPRIIFDAKNDNLRKYLKHKNENPNEPLPTDLLISNFNLKPLFKNQEHINLIKDAMFSSSNEPGGTSYRHRFENPKF